MGIEDTARHSIFHKTTLKHRGTVFSINTRDAVLTTELEASIIVPLTASNIRVSSICSMKFLINYKI